MNHKNEKDRIYKVYENYSKNRSFTKKWSPNNIGNKLINIELKENIIEILKENKILIKNKNILDIGCASGNKIKLLSEIGFNKSKIFGVDLRNNSIDKAKKKSPTSHFFVMDARELLFEDNKFDFINIFTLFSSIQGKNNRREVCHEISRVLKPDGIILYYDLRYGNPFNPNIFPINKKEINKLFSGFKIIMKEITLLPPFARILGRFTSFLYPLFSKIAVFKTHFFCVMINKRN